MSRQEPKIHYATDRRCYEGAWSSDMIKHFNSLDKVLSDIREVRPDYRCVYFPAEDKYMSFVNKTITIAHHVPYEAEVPEELTGNFYEDKGQCLLEAWRIIAGRE